MRSLSALFSFKCNITRVLSLHVLFMTDEIELE